MRMKSDSRCNGRLTIKERDKVAIYSSDDGWKDFHKQKE